jgi:hypothetical protein
MEIEYEARGIEELLQSDNNEYIPITVTLKNKGEFLAYITPLKYGELPKEAKAGNEYKIGQKVLLEHIFTANKEPITLAELKLMPAGMVVEFINAIKMISGFNDTPEDVENF